MRYPLRSADEPAGITQGAHTSSPLRAHRVDAHAHLDKYPEAEWDGICRQIEALGILTLSVTVDPESFGIACQIAQRCPFVVPSFGIQPWEAPRFAHSHGLVSELCERSPMIGEIGLDHHFVTDRSAQRSQLEVFGWLLDHAARENKIVNVHCTGAEAKVHQMIRDRDLKRVIIHWYAGDPNLLLAMCEDGYLFTVGAAVRHSNHISSLAKIIPDTQLLVETDNPGGERWHTGCDGQPRLLTAIEGRLARLRDVTPSSLRATVRANAKRLLGHDPHLAAWTGMLHIERRDADQSDDQPRPGAVR